MRQYDNIDLENHGLAEENARLIALLRAECMKAQELGEKVSGLEATVKETVEVSGSRIIELEAEVTRLSELLWGSRCVYCGEVVGKDRQNQDIADEVLRQHVEKCPKHPVAALRKELEQARAAGGHAQNCHCHSDLHEFSCSGIYGSHDHPYRDPRCAAAQPSPDPGTTFGADAGGQCEDEECEHHGTRHSHGRPAPDAVKQARAAGGHYHCEGCGAYLSALEIESTFHTRAESDRDGAPVPVQCGPVRRCAVAQPNPLPYEEDADEAYIKTLKWSPKATEWEKTLVNGNIRTFWKVVLAMSAEYQRQQKPSPDALTRIQKAHEAVDALAPAYWTVENRKEWAVAVKEAHAAIDELAESLRPVEAGSGEVEKAASELFQAILSLRNASADERTDVMTYAHECAERLAALARSGGEVPDEIKKARQQGLEEGIRRYAWWKNGTQYVGCGVQTLEQALKDAK